jgi:regulator of replication initiation timing
MIEEKIEALSTEDVEYSGTVVNVDFIEVDRPKLSEVDQLKEDLKAAKAKIEELSEENNGLAAQIVKLQNDLVDARAGKSKAPAKESKGAADSGAPAGVDKKLAAKAEQDGAAKSKELKKMNEEYGNKYFAAGITAAEGNPKALECSMNGANKSTAALGKVFASEGPTSLAVCIYVPDDSEVNIKEWLDAAMEGIGGMAVATDINDAGNMISLKVDQNTEAGRFPIKDKDEVIAGAFTFIRAKGLLNEADDDDEPDMSALGEV